MKHKKAVVIFVVLLIIFASTSTFASSNLTEGINISKDKANEVSDIGNKIFGLVTSIGIICSVVALALLGIKYMLSSVEEKAEYKKTFGVYIVGAMLVFGVSTFAKIIYNFSDSVFSTIP